MITIEKFEKFQKFEMLNAYISPWKYSELDLKKLANLILKKNWITADLKARSEKG